MLSQKLSSFWQTSWTPSSVHSHTSSSLKKNCRQLLKSACYRLFGQFSPCNSQLVRMRGTKESQSPQLFPYIKSIETSGTVSGGRIIITCAEQDTFLSSRKWSINVLNLPNAMFCIITVWRHELKLFSNKIMYCSVKACITIAWIMSILWILNPLSLFNVEKKKQKKKTQGNSHVCSNPFYLINKEASKQFSEQKFFEQQFLLQSPNWKKKKKITCL